MATRDRGDVIARTLTSLLRSHAEFELLVIDQSASDDTQRCVESFTDPRLRYIRSSDVGLSRARNRALQEARNDSIIMTDDDCIAAPNFVEAMVAELAAPGNPSLVFADVLDPDIAANTWTPVNRAVASYTVDDMSNWRSTDSLNIGVGAAMALDRRVVMDLGGFDAELGAGSLYHSAEDTDLALRVVLGGGAVRRTTRTWVDHYGARDHEESRRLIHGALFGIGAACGKLTRAGHASVARRFARVVWDVVVRPGLHAVVRARRPPVARRAINLCRGFIAGWRRPVDPTTLVFLPSLLDDGVSTVDG